MNMRVSLIQHAELRFSYHLDNYAISLMSGIISFDIYVGGYITRSDKCNE